MCSSDLQYLRAMFGGFGNRFVDNAFLYQMNNYWLILLILCIGATTLPAKLAQKTKLDQKLVTRMLFILVVFGLSVAYLVDASYNPFLYFRF